MYVNSGALQNPGPGAFGINHPGFQPINQPTSLEGAQTSLYGAQAAHAGDPLAAAKLQNQLGYQQEANKSARFSSIFGLLGGALNGANGGMARSAANLDPRSNIQANPVYDPQQIQQQQNANASQIAQGAAGQDKAIQERTAGAGFGANSPLMMALQGANQAAARGQTMSTNTQLGLGAAQANQQAVLAGQTAQAGNVNQYNQNLIENAKPYWQRQNSLIAALGGMV